MQRGHASPTSGGVDAYMPLVRPRKARPYKARPGDAGPRNAWPPIVRLCIVRLCMIRPAAMTGMQPCTRPCMRHVCLFCLRLVIAERQFSRGSLAAPVLGCTLALRRPAASGLQG